jgi:hypothetical protein
VLPFCPARFLPCITVRRVSGHSTTRHCEYAQGVRKGFVRAESKRGSTLLLAPRRHVKEKYHPACEFPPTNSTTTSHSYQKWNSFTYQPNSRLSKQVGSLHIYGRTFVEQKEKESTKRSIQKMAKPCPSFSLSFLLLLLLLSFVSVFLVCLFFLFSPLSSLSSSLLDFPFDGREEDHPFYQ